MSPTGSRGFSLIEILLVIGLVGALSGGAFLLYQRVQGAQNVSDTVERVVVITGNLRQFFGDGSFSGLTRATAISAGAVAEADMSSPWGPIDVSADSGGNTFRIDISNVPQDECQDLLPALEMNAGQLRVGSTVVKDNANGQAFDIFTAGAACSSAANTVSLWPNNEI